MTNNSIIEQFNICKKSLKQDNALDTRENLMKLVKLLDGLFNQKEYMFFTIEFNNEINKTMFRVITKYMYKYSLILQYKKGKGES